MTVPVIK